MCVYAAHTNDNKIIGGNVLSIKQFICWFEFADEQI